MKTKKVKTEGVCCAMRCKKPAEYLHIQPDGEQLWWCKKHSAQVAEGAATFNVQLDIKPYSVVTQFPPTEKTVTSTPELEQGLVLAPRADLGTPEVILSTAQIENLQQVLANTERDLAELKELEIVSAEEARFAEGERNQARDAAKHWDTLRKSAKEYWSSGAQRVDKTIMPTVKALQNLDRSWSRALNAYRARVMAEEQRLLQEAQVAQQNGQPEQVREKLVQAATTDAGTGDTYIDNWKFEIVDASQIPREYLTPDTRKIGQAVKALRESCTIPGVRVYNEPYARSK